MSCRGVLMALTKEQEQSLLRAAEPRKSAFGWLTGKKGAPSDSDGPVVEEIHQLDSVLSGDARCDLDLAWDAIQRCFDTGELTFDLDHPAKGFVMGGRRLHHGEDWIISYKTSEQVKAIAAAASGISDHDIGQRYDNLDPDDYEVEKTIEDRAYTIENFTALRGFYKLAAESGRAVVFSADQ